MSRNITRSQAGSTRPLSIHNSFKIDVGTVGQTSQPPEHALPQPTTKMEVNHPHPQYPSRPMDGSMDQTYDAHQARTSTENNLGPPEITVQAARQPMPSSQTRDEYDPYEPSHYSGASRPEVRTPSSSDPSVHHYRSNSHSDSAQGYSQWQRQEPHPEQAFAPYPSPPSQSGSMHHSSPPGPPSGSHYASSQAYERPAQYSSTHIDPNMQYHEPMGYNNSPSYRNSPHIDMYNSQRGMMGGRHTGASPNSLQREIDNLQSRLMDTQRLVDDKNMEINHLRNQLAQGGGGMRSRDDRGNWELHDLRRKLYESDQGLQSAREEASRAKSLAQYQQGQADMFSKQLIELKEIQAQAQAQPKKESPQLDEIRRLADFYKDQVDQLSRENIGVNQQNRKLNDDLSVAQRELQQQKNFVDSLR